MCRWRPGDQSVECFRLERFRSAHPGRKLAVPHHGVAPQTLAILLGRVGRDITRAVSELALRRLGGIPLLSVLGDELAKLALVAEDGSVRAVAVDGALAKGSTEVLETGADGEV